MKTAAQVVEPIQSYMIGTGKPIMFMFKQPKANLLSVRPSTRADKSLYSQINQKAFDHFEQLATEFTGEPKDLEAYLRTNSDYDLLGLVMLPGLEVKPGMQFHRIIGDAKQPYAQVFTVLSVIWKKDTGSKYDKLMFNPGFKQSFYWMLEVEIQGSPLANIIELEF